MVNKSVITSYNDSYSQTLAQRAHSWQQRDHCHVPVSSWLVHALLTYHARFAALVAEVPTLAPTETTTAPIRAALTTTEVSSEFAAVTAAEAAPATTASTSCGLKAIVVGLCPRTQPFVL